MGKFSIFAALVARKIRNRLIRFNAENRAYRVIEKEKPTRAPTYEATMKQVEKLCKENPKGFEELREKNQELVENLRSVYVKSESKNPEIPVAPKLERVTDIRVSYKEFKKSLEERDKKEKEVAPLGKYTLDQLMQLVAKYRKDPETNSIEKLSELSCVDSKILGPILEHVLIFSMYIPAKKNPVLSSFKRFAGEAEPVFSNMTQELVTEDEIHKEFKKKVERDEKLKHRIKAILEEHEKRKVAREEQRKKQIQEQSTEKIPET